MGDFPSNGGGAFVESSGFDANGVRGAGLASWYVAKTKGQKESWVESVLTRMDVEVFSPRIVGRKRGKATLEPLFPTYVFCRLELDRPDWPAIRWAHGLNYFLGVDDIPVPVPDEMVEYLRRRVADWNGSVETTHRFSDGDPVTVAYGPFAGLDGIFQSYVRAGERCRILLQVVGRLSSVELREYDLHTADPLP